MHRLAEPGFLLGAAEAGMPGANRPRAEADVAEADRRTVGIGFRTLAAELVEAEALTVAFVAELEREAPGIEMRAPLAVLVDQSAIGEFRPVLPIELGRPTEGEEIEDGREEIVGARRAARNIDHQLAGNDGLRADRAGRVGIGRLDATPGGARADGDDGGGALGGLAHEFDLRLAADLAVDAAVLHRRAALGHQHVLAFVLVHHRVLVIERLLAGADAQRVVIVEGDDVEQEAFQRRVVGAQQRLGAAGAFLAMQPDHRRPSPAAAASAMRTPAADESPIVAAMPAQNCSICRRLMRPRTGASGSGPRTASKSMSGRIAGSVHGTALSEFGPHHTIKSAGKRR